MEKPGPPHKCDKGTFRHIIYMLAEGKTMQEIANELQVHRRTIYEWLSQNEQYWDQINETRAIIDRQVETSLYRKAMGYTYEEEKVTTNNGAFTDKIKVVKHVPPDVEACKWWLKNRQPEKWRDKREMSFDPNEMADDQLEELAIQIIRNKMERETDAARNSEQKNKATREKPSSEDNSL